MGTHELVILCVVKACVCMYGVCIDSVEEEENIASHRKRVLLKRCSYALQEV